jgi:APA family basic amino acid/polyamine antiporter
VTEHKPSLHAHLGLFGATALGVGAIVGGGILVLAGTALSVAGPAAILAFALNGLIAFLTALSFAEMASRFPESGGMYVFAKKVLSIEAAFSIGWVVWFASIAAATLYALGFAHFLLIMVDDLGRTWFATTPAWLLGRPAVAAVAITTTVLVALQLIHRPAGGGHWVNLCKLLVFGGLILAGMWAAYQRPAEELADQLQPFFAGGWRGLIQAMGYSFIALQGFDLIASVSGEVQQPSKTVPRAMILSLAIALATYIPLLLIVATVGSPSGESIQELAQKDPDGVIALAARHFVGPFGYWLVIVAAILATFTALVANLFAASRIAQAMAWDRTLPSWLRLVRGQSGTPHVAIAVTAGIAVALMLIIPDISAAGAASSLIFLVTFASAHWVAMLIRRRSIGQPSTFQTPWFPAIPVLGGLACLALAIFQSVAVLSAGIVASIWLAIGGLLFLKLFARRARVRDAASRAFDPELVRLRGRSPLALVPVANPANVESMMALATALSSADVGRLRVMAVIVIPPNWQPVRETVPFEKAEAVVRAAVQAGLNQGITAETMVTASEDPVTEIARAANQIECDFVVLGFSEITDIDTGTPTERLLRTIDADVVVMRAPAGWELSNVRRILVPVAGQGDHDELRACLLGSLLRLGERDIKYLRVLPADAADPDIQRARRNVGRLVTDELPAPADVVVEANDDPVAVAAQHADDADLIILGIHRLSPTEKLFGSFTRQLALNCQTPLLVISRRG